MRTAVGMSSGLTLATSGDGAAGAGSPAPTAGVAGAGCAPDSGVLAAVVVAGGFLLPDLSLLSLFSLGALSLGPAATLVAMTSDENTTTVEVARMRNLQPALAGDSPTLRAGRGPTPFPVACCRC